MNLVQQAEQIKHVPDQQLQAMLQNPGMVPGYLVIAESQRRASMRKAYQAAQSANPMNQKTVAQEMINMSPGQVAPGVTGPGPSAPPVQGYAKGGVMRLAGGDMIDDPPEIIPTWPNTQRPEQESALPVTREALAAMMPRTSIDYTPPPSALKGLAEEYAGKEKMFRERKTKLGDILMSLGLGMAASRRPDWGGAIAEGGIAALNNWTSNREHNQAQADKYAAARRGVLESEQRSNDVFTREQGELKRAQVAADNTDLITLAANQRAIFTAQEHAKIEEMKQAGLVSAAKAKLLHDTVEAEKDRKLKMDLEGERGKNNLATAKVRALGKIGKNQMDPAMKAEEARAQLARKEYSDTFDALLKTTPMPTEADIAKFDKIARAKAKAAFPDAAKYLGAAPAGGGEEKQTKEKGMLEKLGEWWNGVGQGSAAPRRERMPDKLAPQGLRDLITQPSRGMSTDEWGSPK